MPANVKQILLNNNLHWSMNSNWRAYFQDLANYCTPRKAWITTIKTDGARVDFNHLYDSTAVRAVKTMAAGFHSNLTNPSSQWFGLESKDRELMKQKEIGVWFADVVGVMLQMLNQSNFDTAMQEFYQDYGVFGTGTLLTMEDDISDLRFLTIPIQEVSIEEDAYGRVCGVYRNFQLTVIQAYMAWGEKAGKTCSDKYRDEKYFEKMDFVHYVGRRKEYDPTKRDTLNLPWESCWIAKKDAHLILESGFKENPYQVGRFWKDNTEVMGYAPSMDVLADIKTVNAAVKTMLRRSMKDTDPAMLAPSRGLVLPLNLNPSAMNYRDPNTPSDSLTTIGGPNGAMPITLEVIQMFQANIKEGFFVPLFQALSLLDKDMTVPEVRQRVAENMVLLGPVVGRATHEVLDPLIIRVFNIGYAKGKFPPPPQALQGQEWTPVYLSPLARAQRSDEIANIEQFLGRVANIAAVKPEVLDKIDEDQTVDVIAQIQNINPKILRDPQNVEALRTNRANLQKMTAEMDAAHKGAAIAKTGAEAEKAGAEAAATTKGKK